MINKEHVPLTEKGMKTIKCTSLPDSITQSSIKISSKVYLLNKVT